ncbi:cobalamin-binding protein [Bacteriovoracaceae bacterium]|nr:cobalamin-binding protein [Bacteriovoracaceae bacterium]
MELLYTNDLKRHYPKRVICLTEESVEIMYALGLEERIIGVSSFIERPEIAKKKPRVSGFTNANIKKIVKMKPDLVLGYSDIQKDIAKELIGHGLNVYIANHRSIFETLQFTLWLSSFLGVAEEGSKLVGDYQKILKRLHEKGKLLKNRPKVYFEEWNDPMISSIQWVSELIEICGGINIFSSQANETLAKNRIVESQKVVSLNPDIIFGCWCGKKVEIDDFGNRENWNAIKAVKNKDIYELDPSIFLQPGPAPIINGGDILLDYFHSWEKRQNR